MLGSPEEGKQASLVHGKQRRKSVPCSEESTVGSSCRTKESLVAITGVDLSEGSRNQLAEEWRGEEGPTPNIGRLLQRRMEVLDQIASLLTLPLLLRHDNRSMKAQFQVLKPMRIFQLIRG